MPNQLRRAVYGIFGRGLRLRHGDGIPYLGHRLEAPSKWIEPHTRARIFLRRYELAESQMVRAHLRPDLPVIELGCGIGVVSREIGARLRDDVDYVGVEANPDLVKVARQNVATAGHSRFRVLHRALAGKSTDEQTVTFSITGDNFRYSSAEETGRADVQTVEVQVATLDEIVAEIGDGSYQLVSDIEGGERHFIDPVSPSLERCHMIIIELHDVDEWRIEDLADALERAGFEQLERRRQTFAFRRKA